MKLIPERFPQERRRNPKRWAEARVFDTLARSGLEGCAIYEWGSPEQPHQLDFAVWLTNVGRFAVEVKGGRYTLEEGHDRWLLQTPHGMETKPSPLNQVTVAAQDLRRELRRQNRRDVPVIPVVAFPDMAPDPAIERRSQSAGVRVIWGTGRLLPDLEAIARRLGVKQAPRAAQMRDEVRAVTVGTERSQPAGTNAASSTLSLRKFSAGTGVAIGHVDRVVVRRVPEA